MIKYNIIYNNFRIIRMFGRLIPVDEISTIRVCFLGGFLYLAVNELITAKTKNMFCLL